jgi:hypothetical protein
MIDLRDITIVAHPHSMWGGEMRMIAPTAGVSPG